MNREQLSFPIVIQQLDRWIAMKADHRSADYTQALIDFRNLLLGEGPYSHDTCIECGHGKRLHWVSAGGEGCDAPGCQCSGRSEYA